MYLLVNSHSEPGWDVSVTAAGMRVGMRHSVKENTQLGHSRLSDWRANCSLFRLLHWLPVKSPTRWHRWRPRCCRLLRKHTWAIIWSRVQTAAPVCSISAVIRCPVMSVPRTWTELASSTGILDRGFAYLVVNIPSDIKSCRTAHAFERHLKSPFVQTVLS